MSFPILAIDPSIRNIGIAMLQITDRKISHLQDSTYYATKESSKLSICEGLMRFLLQFCNNIKNAPFYVVIEYPQFMGGQKGQLAAQQGYTIDIAMVCGYLAAALKQSRKNTFFYTPCQWKGQQPKTATQAKFKRIFPDCEPDSEHSCDAAMLGYWFAKKANLIE